MNKVGSELSVSDKILLAIYELDKNRVAGKKITKEEMVVQVWKMFPEEFCIKGYPQYPNADISKYVTKLFKENLLKGSFYNYILTSKGREYAERISSGAKIDKKGIVVSGSREIEAEIRRIKGSKVFHVFLKGENNFLESDLFDFLGTSSRSFNDSNKTAFMSKYNLIVKEVIPFCKKIDDKDPEARKIISLSQILLQKFRDILSKT
jgi:hypothetical protein